MRFHFGFSKFIKPSKLLYWLGLGFLIILGYFGVVDNAFAETLDVGLSQDYRSYITTYWTTTFTKNNGVNLSQGTAVHTWNNSYRMYLSPGWSTPWLIGGYNNNNPIFIDYEWTLNKNSCSNISGANSVDLYFNATGYSENTFNNYFSHCNLPSLSLPQNGYTISDVNTYYVIPYNDDETVVDMDRYYCNISPLNDDSSSWVYQVSCLMLPIKQHYEFHMLNDLAYESMDQTNSYDSLYGGSYCDIPVGLQTFSPTFDYACSDVEPIEPEHPIFPEDIEGSSNITIVTGSSGGVTFDTNGSMDYSYIELAYPNTLTQFIEFPLYIANSLINNHDSCTPITIDFSSIVRRWGGGNNSSYYLTFPCLGTTIYNIFNVPIFGEEVSLYNLMDMFIAFVLLYMLATRMVILINMLMSGEDMVGYLYSGTETASVDSSTGVVSKRRRRY